MLDKEPHNALAHGALGHILAPTRRHILTTICTLIRIVKYPLITHPRTYIMTHPLTPIHTYHHMSSYHTLSILHHTPSYITSSHITPHTYITPFYITPFNPLGLLLLGCGGGNHAALHACGVNQAEAITHLRMALRLDASLQPVRDALSFCEVTPLGLSACNINPTNEAELSLDRQLQSLNLVDGL